MQTTCPECHTTFRVSQDHLGARRGLVRCGTCNAVFNAYDTLLPELESPPDEDGLDSASKGLETAAESVAEVSADASAEASAGAGSDEFLSQQTLADYAIQTTDSVELTSKSGETRASVAFTSGNPSPPEDETDALPAVAQSAHIVERKTEPNIEPNIEPDILFEPLWKRAEKKPRTWKFWSV